MITLKEWQELNDDFWKQSSDLNPVNKGVSQWNLFWKDTSLKYNLKYPYSISDVYDMPVFKKVYHDILRKKLELL